MSSWGIVATIKAPVLDTLHFASYHLSLGAARIYIYLDDASEAAFGALETHPQLHPIRCDEAWWAKRGRRPLKHQVRQARNATHAYRRLCKERWLIHMDVDEFLVPAADTRVGDLLDQVERDARTLRVRPMEQLSGDPTLFKAFIPPDKSRHRTVEKIYPTFGRYLKGGFLSHLAGKVFVRTGVQDMKLRIHNAFLGDEMNPGEVELTDLALAHAHAKTWEQFLKAYRFRLEQGSYRSELAPERARDKGGLTLHELFQQIEDQEGETGLRAFFEEVSAATPRLTKALEKRGLLRHVDLDLPRHLERHFPEYR